MTFDFKFEIRQIVHCTDSDLDLGAVVLAKAFEKDSFTVATTGNSGFDTIVAFERAFIAAAAKGGILYFAYDEHGDVVGVSAWFQPGHAFLAEKEQGEAGMNQVFQSFPPQLSKWWTEQFLSQYAKQCERALGTGYKLDSWHLQLLGVSPEQQRKGIGAALVKAGEDRAKVEKKPVVIEASEVDNVEKFYKKIGYKVKPCGPPEHPDYEEFTDFEGKHAFNSWVLAKEFE